MNSNIDEIKKKFGSPIDGEKLHDALLKLKSKASFVVNNRYHCIMPKIQENDASKLFSEFKKDVNSPRLTSAVDVEAYDILEGIELHGQIALNIDEDLIHKKDATIYVKPRGQQQWKSGERIMKIDVIEQGVTI